MNIYEKLAAVQYELKAPKSQVNEFGKYKYRSCEDIVEAVKPLLNKYGLLLTLTDLVKLIGERFYIEATAKVVDIGGEGVIAVSAYAREEENKKGMDGSQITGASSSYARKYALNGLFAIDDTKDSDATNTHDKEEQPKKQEKQEKQATPRQMLIAKLKEKGIDVNTYAAEKGLNSKTTAERFNELLAELG
jgi:hypothetical protein